MTVDYATSDLSASAGSDYTAASGTLTFPAGITEQAIPVTTIDDADVEANETFHVDLTSPANASIAGAHGLGTILNNDRPPTSVSINSTSQNTSVAPAVPVAEQDKAIGTGYSVLAINDLGMHCGDLDTRIASILPPFQILLTQVVQKGGTGTTHLNPAGITLCYSAASSPSDPIL